MKKDDEISEWSVKYFTGLADELKDLYRSQAESISDLKGIAIETKVLLAGMKKKQDDQDEKIKDNEDRLRVVENSQNSCPAITDIKILRDRFDRLDIVKNEDQKKSKDDNMSIKIVLWRWLPMLILSFVIGVVVATVIATKVLSGETVVLPSKIMSIQANSSSSDKK